ncbi:MAG: hypothetical protein DRO67_01195 [Candidatus Asgardarchaeum californiense]|nr:MAG: hypothetical protein DRO67_01195 [Candidatus Asgardarchaeum californiense]
MSGTIDNMTFSDWVDCYITYDKDTKEYIAWDETQIYEIARYKTKEEARQAIYNYIECLNMVEK